MFRTIISSLSLLTLLVGCGKGNSAYQPFETLDGVGANAPVPEELNGSAKVFEFLHNSVPGVSPITKSNAKISLVEEKNNRFAKISLNAKSVSGDHRARLRFTDIGGELVSTFKYMSYYTRIDKVISSPKINNAVVLMHISPECNNNSAEDVQVYIDYMVTDDSSDSNMGPGPMGQMNKYQFQFFDKVYMAADDKRQSGLPHVTSGQALGLNTLVTLNPEACFSEKGVELLFGHADKSANDEYKVDDVMLYFDAGANARVTYYYDFEEEVEQSQEKDSKERSVKSIDYLTSI